MSPVNRKSVEEKLKKLEEVVGHLEEYKKISKKDFLKDHTINGAAIHYLVLSIEIIADIGNHILNEVFQSHPKEYKEIIEMLGESKVISEDFAKENADMAKFRNLLIHEYIKVDLEKVYRYLQKAPGIFREFAKAYQEFLDKV